MTETCCPTWIRNLKRCQGNVFAVNDSLMPLAFSLTELTFSLANTHPAVLMLELLQFLGYDLHDELILGGVMMLTESRDGQVIIARVLFQRHTQESGRRVVPVHPFRKTITITGSTNLMDTFFLLVIPRERVIICIILNAGMFESFCDGMSVAPMIFEDKGRLEPFNLRRISGREGSKLNRKYGFNGRRCISPELGEGRK